MTPNDPSGFDSLLSVLPSLPALPVLPPLLSSGAQPSTSSESGTPKEAEGVCFPLDFLNGPPPAPPPCFSSSSSSSSSSSCTSSSSSYSCASSSFASLSSTALPTLGPLPPNTSTTGGGLPFDGPPAEPRPLAAKGKGKAVVVLPVRPLQLPAHVHYTKTEDGKRVTVRGIFHHCDESHGKREFLWDGKALSTMSIFEFDDVVYVKPTTVQHQFRRDEHGQPVNGKGWNAIFASECLIPPGDDTNPSKKTRRRCYTLQHFRMSVGFQNNPHLSIEQRDTLCRRARDHYKSDAFITLLGKKTLGSTDPSPAAGAHLTGKTTTTSWKGGASASKMTMLATRDLARFELGDGAGTAKKRKTLGCTPQCLTQWADFIGDQVKRVVLAKPSRAFFACAAVPQLLPPHAQPQSQPPKQQLFGTPADTQLACSGVATCFPPAALHTPVEVVTCLPDWDMLTREPSNEEDCVLWSDS